MPRYEWHQLYAPAGRGPILVLTADDVWLVCTYRDNSCKSVTRFFDHLTGTWEEPALELERVPPGYLESLDSENPRGAARYLAILNRLGLKHGVDVHYPRKPLGYGSRVGSHLLFFNLPRALAEGTRKEYAYIRDMLPAFMVPWMSRELKLARAEAKRLKPMSLWERYPVADTEELHRMLREKAQHMDCADSFRVCRVTPRDRNGYRKFVKARSCCGSCEWDVDLHGSTYRLGFNYGH